MRRNAFSYANHSESSSKSRVRSFRQTRARYVSLCPWYPVTSYHIQASRPYRIRRAASLRQADNHFVMKLSEPAPPTCVPLSELKEAVGLQVLISNMASATVGHSIVSGCGSTRSCLTVLFTHRWYSITPSTFLSRFTPSWRLL